MEVEPGPAGAENRIIERKKIITEGIERNKVEMKHQKNNKEKIMSGPPDISFGVGDVSESTNN